MIRGYPGKTRQIHNFAICKKRKTEMKNANTFPNAKDYGGAKSGSRVYREAVKIWLLKDGNRNPKLSPIVTDAEIDAAIKRFGK
jgi:hypothetical protein